MSTNKDVGDENKRPLLDSYDVEANDNKGQATFGRLLAEAKPEIPQMIVGTVFMLISSLSFYIIPTMSGKVIDTCSKAVAGGDRDVAYRELNTQLEIIIVVLLIGGITGGVRQWLFNGASEKVMCRLREKLFKHLMQQEIGFYDANRTGELMNRLSEDTRAMKDAGTISISMALRSVVSLILGVALMFLTSWRLSTLTLIILPIIILAFKVYGDLSKKYTEASLKSSAAAASIAEECISSMRTVRSFAKEGAATDRYSQAISGVLKWGLTQAAAGAIFSSIIDPLSTGFMMVILWYGGVQVVRGDMTVGELNTFMLYAVFVGGGAGMLASVFASTIQAVGASRRVFQLLDRVPQLPAPGGATPQGAPEGALLQLRDVWFSYPSRPEVQVLKGVSLQVEPGRKLALVGPSGGGKSTVVALVQRFYDPQAGQVLLDGVPVRDIRHSYLHTQVTLVSQEPVLFADSVLYNIAFGLRSDPKSVDMAMVEAAARAANAHDFISALPEGYHTVVGERGVKLSGGQKQRIAIARALLPKPRLLLLDEATSALDAESEYLVQQALDAAVVGRSVVVIAHRLSTVQNADEVAVISSGLVVEQGSHADLLAAGGAYTQLVRRQLTSRGPSTSDLPALLHDD